MTDKLYTAAEYDAMRIIAYQAGYYQHECGLPSAVDEGREVAVSVAEARREALRDVLNSAEKHRDKNWFPSLEGVVLGLLDAEAPAQSPDDPAVDRFAAAMKEKLWYSRSVKGRRGWEHKNAISADYLSRLLREHVEKGDPLDVGNLAMMLHQRGEQITPAQPKPDAVQELKPCPFCGGSFIQWSSSGFGKSYQKCSDCGATGPGKFGLGGNPEGWNTRALARGDSDA